MVISGGRIGDAVLPHDEKGNAVREGPFLVHALGVKIQSLLVKNMVARNNDGVGVASEALSESYEKLPISRSRQEIADLDQDILGREKPARKSPREILGARVEQIAGVDECDVKTRVGEDEFHLLGSP